MACYHFTIKTDKKPDGTKVSASTHVEYIAREGKYKDYELDNMKKPNVYKNGISGSDLVENAFQKPLLLYRSPFGNIIRTKDDIKISDNASVETVAIALAITEKLYGGKINLNGTNTFKAQVLVAANEMDLNLHFTDAVLEQKYIQMREAKDHGRTEFKRSGRNFRKSTGIHAKPNIKQRTLRAVTETGFELPKLSQCRMVSNGKDHELFLSSNDDASLFNQGANLNKNVRWDVSGARRGVVRKVAEEILGNVQKQLDSVFAASHVQYINREAAFKQRGGCIDKNHHLPKWAENSPKRFFAMADKYERVNGVRYREIEFALPNELNLEQQKEIINQFITNHLQDFYYAYAVHDKIGVMSNGEHNTHVHIMFSERKIDKAEKEQERPCHKFFAKAFANATTLTDMRRGGAKKDSKWNGKERAKYLCIMREDFAKIQNLILEKYDIADRVDHRSLKDQMQEAKATGNMRLAQLLDRMPEEHIGPDNALLENNQKVIELQKYRAYKAEHQRLLYAADLLENSLAESLTNKETEYNTSKVAEITHVEEYPQMQQSNVMVSQLKNDMLRMLKEVHALKRVAIWNQTALDMAKLKFMTLEERELWQSLKNLQEQKNHWTTFKQHFKKPSSYQQKNLEVFNALMPELDIHLSTLSEQIRNIATQIEPISKRLASSSVKQKVQKEASKILLADIHTKERLKKINQNLVSTIEKLQQEIDKCTTANDNNEKNIFTAKQLEEILSLRYDDLKNEYDHNYSIQQKLEKQVISYERAMAMAENQYVDGAFKNIREQNRLLKKKETSFSADERAYQEKEDKFKASKKPSFWQDKAVKLEYENKKQSLAQKAIELSHRKEMLCAERNTLNIEQNRLNLLCKTPEGEAKIKSITMGILNKNQPILEQHQASMEKTKASLQKMNHVKKQLQAVAVDKNVQYAVVQNHTHTSSPSVIANAILGDPKAAQLVARLKPGTDEIAKDWEMMSELEKDEKINSIKNLDRY